MSCKWPKKRNLKKLIGKKKNLETVIERTQFQSHLEAREEEFWLCFKSDL